LLFREGEGDRSSILYRDIQIEIEREQRERLSVYNRPSPPAVYEREKVRDKERLSHKLLSAAVRIREFFASTYAPKATQTVPHQLF
jgi:hypothetical protein